MPTFDERLRAAIIARHGAQIDLDSNPSVLRDILTEITREGLASAVSAVDKYDKSYTEGYNKESYSRADYNRYDKTAFTDVDEVIRTIQPDLEQLIIEKFKLPPR